MSRLNSAISGCNVKVAKTMLIFLRLMTLKHTSINYTAYRNNGVSTILITKRG